MLSPSGKLVLQGLLVLQAAASDTHDCCPVKHVEGLGSLSGTYFLVSNSSGNLVDPECRDSCGYVKDEHPDPEQLFCLKFSLETNVKCQEDSPFAPQIMTDDVSVPFLSLTETEGEELLLISKEFPPPPEGEIVDVCEDNQALHVNISSSTIGNFGCNYISLDENSQTNCEELKENCIWGTPLAGSRAGATQKGTTITANGTESATETVAPHTTQTLSTGNEPTKEPTEEPGITLPAIIPALPSWSLKWCPGRIGSNPNRLYSFPQCCFHPITQTPKGNLWGCLNEYDNSTTARLRRTADRIPAK